METVSCLFGHQAEPELAFVASDRLSQSGKTFHVMRCSECGLLFLSPRPTLSEIGQYYPYEEYKQEFASAIEDDPSWWQRWNRRYTMSILCHFVEQAKTSGHLLDVGCGTGNFLAHMHKRGHWELRGLDTNLQAVDYARKRFGFEVFYGTLEEANYAAGSFDLVTFWDVLEHLHDPRQTLQKVRRILRPDGVLALGTPNGGSLDARLFGSHWIGLDPPRHLYIFDLKAVEALLARSGFEITQVKYVIGSYHSFVASVARVIQSDNRVSKFVQQVLCDLVMSVPAHVLMLPYLRATEWMGHGAILSVLARPSKMGM